MRKIKTIIVCAITALTALCATGCTDMLDTEPSDSVTGNTILGSTDGLQVGLDGIYASMYNRLDWVAANSHQCFGNMAVILAAELEGEDMVQVAKGPGWFWRDYTYDNRARYSSKIWRCYFTWKYFYELINNANAILSTEGRLEGDASTLNNIYGQAYAIRAYCYFMLIQSFQQTYVGHQTAPGIPVYTEPTTASTQCKGRGTVEQVYTRINTDLDSALLKLKRSGLEQDHVSHLDYYAASMFKARVALVQNHWEDALTYSDEAIKKPNCSLLTLSEAKVVKGTYSGDGCTTGTTPFNSIKSSSVMWGAEILSNQSTGYASFFSNMDACTSVYYAAEAPKCISNWLYAQIPASDVRKGWWNDNIGIPASGWGYGGNINYNQHKFQWANQLSMTGDYIFMRMEEAYLIKAEAECRLGEDPAARKTLSTFGKNRDKDFDTVRLISKKSGNIQTFASTGNLDNGSLLDEILFQRRVELWGEAGRIFDILRLRKDGWTRSWTINGEESNHTDLLSKYPEYRAFPADFIESILLIPQVELDRNPYINQEDQNPVQ